MTAKSLSPFTCECGSLLVNQEGYLHHDQYARVVTAPFALDESRPLPCKWAGFRFELPTVDLKQAYVKG